MKRLLIYFTCKIPGQRQKIVVIVSVNRAVEFDANFGTDRSLWHYGYGEGEREREKLWPKFKLRHYSYSLLFVKLKKII